MESDYIDKLGLSLLNLGENLVWISKLILFVEID